MNLIMLDEAERLGLSVTQEEVDAEFAAQKKNYEEFPEVRAYIDKYCKSAGISWMATTPQFRISCRV